MKTPFLTILFLAFNFFISAQTNTYSISFENAVHHEAFVTATFPDLTSDVLTLNMGRSSPGRYAIHEFAKNVYGFQATDSKGKALQVTRTNPYQWNISGHDGAVTVNYILFANRGDGTYSQVDETHAHLNIPATFIYAPELADRDIKVDFKVRTDLNWKVATQLPKVSGTTYSAPNVQYFMDSPTEISDFGLREFVVTENNGDKKTIQLALHHNGTEAELDTYFEKVKKVVLEQQSVFGELPDYDYKTYTFLACYIPNASGDGMEHRNSTILTSTRSLANGGMDGNIGTVSHEFFHGWNVERIRPNDLEPFNFAEANMSGALWFAEGFTSYYTNLILCRAKLMSETEYVEGLTGTFNYVWNSPARQFFNPIEMSYQAPFVDAATSVDPVNRENTFISYYSFGSVLGLALDLSLRAKGLNLDDYFKLIWKTYGKNEIPYTIKNLHDSLKTYAGNDFGDTFFNKYIYKSEMPDYTSLLNSVGVSLTQNLEAPYFGASVAIDKDLNGEMKTNSIIGSPAYIAGLAKGDIITAVNNMPFPNGQRFDDFLKTFKTNDVLNIDFIRFGTPKKTTVTLISNPEYTIELADKKGEKVSKKILEKRNQWLKIE